MKPHDHRRRPTDASFGPELSTALAQALRWRDQWRAEVAAKDKPPAPRSRADDSAKRSAHYATQIARSEFGRFYWNDELARRMTTEMDRSYRRKRDEESRRSGPKEARPKRNGAGR